MVWTCNFCTIVNHIHLTTLKIFYLLRKTLSYSSRLKMDPRMIDQSLPVVVLRGHMTETTHRGLRRLSLTHPEPQTLRSQRALMRMRCWWCRAGSNNLRTTVWSLCTSVSGWDWVVVQCVEWGYGSVLLTLTVKCLYRLFRRVCASLPKILGIWISINQVSCYLCVLLVLPARHTPEEVGLWCALHACISISGVILAESAVFLLQLEVDITDSGSKCPGERLRNISLEITPTHQKFYCLLNCVYLMLTSFKPPLDTSCTLLIESVCFSLDRYLWPVFWHPRRWSGWVWSHWAGVCSTMGADQRVDWGQRWAVLLPSKSGGEQGSTASRHWGAPSRHQVLEGACTRACY